MRPFPLLFSSARSSQQTHNFAYTFPSSIKMVAGKTKCTVESLLMLMVYSNILLVLIFAVGILTHSNLLPSTNHHQRGRTSVYQSVNAADQEDPLPSPTKASSRDTRAVSSAMIPQISQHGLFQPNYRKAITYEITHLLLVLLQYKCCSQILYCNPDQPGRTAVQLWRTLAFLGAGGSLLYALPAFAIASKETQAIQSNTSAQPTQADVSVD